MEEGREGAGEGQGRGVLGVRAGGSLPLIMWCYTRVAQGDASRAVGTGQENDDFTT